MPSYYQILGISANASEGEIKRAYRQLAKAHHPDLNPGDVFASRRFQDITEAYQVLNNPSQRKLYDEQLSYRTQQAQTSNGSPATPKTRAEERAMRRKKNRENYVYVEAPNKNIQRFATIGIVILFGLVLLIPIIALIHDIRANKSQEAPQNYIEKIEKDRAEKKETGLTSFFDTDKIVFYLPELYGNHYQLTKKFKNKFLLPLNEALLADTTKLIQVECFTSGTDKKALVACTDIHQNLSKQDINIERIKTFISNDSINFVLNKQFFYIVVTIAEDI